MKATSLIFLIALIFQNTGFALEAEEQELINNVYTCLEQNMTEFYMEALENSPEKPIKIKSGTLLSDHDRKRILKACTQSLSDFHADGEF